MFKFFKKKETEIILTPGQQLQKLKEQFGTNLNYIDVVIPLTYSEVEIIYGPVCKDYEPLCACCTAWLEWQKTKRVTVVVERDEILKLLK